VVGPAQARLAAVQQAEEAVVPAFVGPVRACGGARRVGVVGKAAFPPRDILPLSIPKAGPVKEERPALELPKRGPEISEVR